MKRKICWGVLLLLVVFLTTGFAKESKGESKMPKKIVYQVMWSSTNVSGKIFINSIEIAEIKSSTAAGGVPLNLWLLGENEISVELNKMEKSEPASFSLNVSQTELGEVASTSDKGNLVSLEIADGNFAKAKTVKAAKKFKSTFDFSQHLLAKKDSKVEEKAVIEYGAKIYRLFEKKDAQNILEEFSVKIEDTAKAFGVDAADFRGQFKTYLEDDLFKAKLEKFDLKSIKAKRSGQENNLWHLLDGDKELIRTIENGGATGQMPVYVGEIGGELKVLR